MSRDADRPLGFQQIAVLTSAQALTIPAGCSIAVIQAEGQVVRWRDDGTNPTASVGMRIPVGGELVYDATGLTSLRFIEEAATAKINVTYYGG